jgi:hypothetical protein
MEVAGANRRWRLQFRYRGSRRKSAVAQLFSLGGVQRFPCEIDYVAIIDNNLFSFRADWFSIVCGHGFMACISVG